LFLSRQELIELTGFKRPSRQILQLKSMKIPYRVNGRGHPVVAKDQVTGAAYMPHVAWSPNVVATSPLTRASAR
jgi:hypothetical protein